MQKHSLGIKQCASNACVAGGQEKDYHHFAIQKWDQRTGGCLEYAVCQKDKTFPAMMAYGRGDQFIHTSPTKIKKSKNTSSVEAVRVHRCGRLDNCNTIYPSESHVMEEAPSASSSCIRRAISVSPRPKIKPTRAARVDTGTFVDAGPEFRELPSFLGGS